MPILKWRVNHVSLLDDKGLMSMSCMSNGFEYIEKWE